MSNKENFLKLVSGEDTKTIAKVKERIKNRAMLRESQNIALKVLMKLDELHWSQKTLAEKMNVSPQQVSKIVSGKENLTLETQVKLQEILGIPVLASYIEKQKEERNIFVIVIEENFPMHSLSDYFIATSKCQHVFKQEKKIQGKECLS